MKLDGMQGSLNESLTKSRSVNKSGLNKAQEAMERLRAEAENLKKSNVTGGKCY